MDSNLKRKLTAALCKSMPLPETKPIIVWDTEAPGFGLRLTPPSSRFPVGTRSFILNYRNADNREKRLTIGRFPDWSPERARKKALTHRQAVADGGDPLADEQSKRQAPTMNDLCKRYMVEHAVRKRSKAEDESMIRQHVKTRFGRMKVAEVKYADIAKLHRELKDTPFRANRAVALLSKMFSLAIRWEMRTDNPASGIERYPEESRERYLKPEEQATLAKVLAEHPDQDSADIVRLLMFTGARRGEVLAARWNQFNNSIWTKPSASTKTKRPHRVPLNAPALEILARVRERAGDVSEDNLVFPGRGGVQRADINKFWRSIREATGLHDLRLHDLRHSYASQLASAGVSLQMIGALLGHTQMATTLRYSHLFDDPLKAATERAGAAIAAAGSDEGAEVIPIKDQQ